MIKNFYLILILFVHNYKFLWIYRSRNWLFYYSDYNGYRCFNIFLFRLSNKNYKKFFQKIFNSKKTDKEQDK